MADQSEIPVFSYSWTDESCEQMYRYYIEQIQLIQESARRQIEPLAKKASYYHSIGTVPTFVTMVKP